MTRSFDGYEISTDAGRLDRERVHRWLATDTYWAVDRPRDIVDRSIAGSLNYGLYRTGDGGEQVGFARAVTDGATFAWLCDVYVAPSERGRGLGSWLVRAVRDDLRDRGVSRVLLATKDAHEVYRRLGWTPLAEPAAWMQQGSRYG